MAPKQEADKPPVFVSAISHLIYLLYQCSFKLRLFLPRKRQVPPSTAQVRLENCPFLLRGLSLPFFYTGSVKDIPQIVVFCFQLGDLCLCERKGLYNL
eukprot:scaffold3946_cov177-Amphora_coffeaeformis.AAC.5